MPSAWLQVAARRPKLGTLVRRGMTVDVKCPQPTLPDQPDGQGRREDGPQARATVPHSGEPDRQRYAARVPEADAEGPARAAVRPVGEARADGQSRRGRRRPEHLDVDGHDPPRSLTGHVTRIAASPAWRRMCKAAKLRRCVQVRRKASAWRAISLTRCHSGPPSASTVHSSAFSRRSLSRTGFRGVRDRCFRYIILMSGLL